MTVLRVLFAPFLVACVELTATATVASCDEVLKVRRWRTEQLGQWLA